MQVKKKCDMEVLGKFVFIKRNQLPPTLLRGIILTYLHILFSIRIIM